MDSSARITANERNTYVQFKNSLAFPYTENRIELFKKYLRFGKYKSGKQQYNPMHTFAVDRRPSD